MVINKIKIATFRYKKDISEDLLKFILWKAKVIVWLNNRNNSNACIA